MLKSVIAATCLCAATTAVRNRPTADHDLVAGTTVEIDTLIGTKLPVRYARDNKLSGEEARSLASYLGAVSDDGRWWVNSDQLCDKWNRWSNSEPLACG